jgi:hypothetical protein
MQSLDTSRFNDGDLRGVFARFTEIDVNGAWFNAENLDAADVADVAQISIPQHLRPNYVPFLFQFRINGHILVFETSGKNGTLSVKAVHKYLTSLTQTEEIRRAFGNVLVDIVSDSEKVSNMLSQQNIIRLDILARRTNPDDAGGYEEEFKRRLEELGAQSFGVSVTAEPNKEIKPDAEIKKLAAVAITNGRVRVTVVENGIRVPQASDDHPRTAYARYNPDLTSENDAFLNASADLARHTRRNRNLS